MTGQLLWSRPETPNRPDLAAEWDGRRLSGHGGEAWWPHSTRRVDLFTDYKDFGGGFRADDGFVPHHRTGTGVNASLLFTVRPTDHLELRFNEARRFLNVTAAGRSAQLFTAKVDRLRATYMLTARTCFRAVGQWVETRRHPSLYTTDVARRDGDLSASALFAYKLNWQTVLFAGYGYNRELDDLERLQKLDRQFFVKLSYAFQR